LEFRRCSGYSRHFASKATFTNIYRMVFEGHDAFEKRHAETFATFFKGSVRRETILNIRLVTHPQRDSVEFSPESS
jgi:hypothetical protein